MGMLFNRPKLQARAKEIETSRRQIKDLQVQVGELSDNILFWVTQASSFRGTKYNTYETQITAANAMYNGTADWGVNQMAALLQARIGFIMPKGFKVVSKIEGDVSKEQEFADSFIQFNGLAKENIYHFLSESELEGKVLFNLAYDTVTPWFKAGEKAPLKGMTSVRYISQVSNPYSITVNENDYMLIEKAVYKGADQKDHDILEPSLVYRKFGGRLNQINTTSSKILKVLTQIEDLDHALRDFREANHLFAVPIPECETLNAKDAVDMSAAFNKSNWKPGKMFFHTGKAGYMQPTNACADTLWREIVTLAEMISFNTGVPVHYWFPDLATNRATAEDISWGLINSATSRERNIWEGLLEEMINKAIAIYNDKAKMTPLRQGVLGVHIPVVTKDDWERITSIWMPLFTGKAITLKTLLSKLPDELDVEEEVKAVEEESGALFDRMKDNGVFDETDTAGIKGDVRQGDAKGLKPQAETEDVAATAMNGSQISSLVEVVTSAASGQLPVAAVMPILVAAFPNTPDAVLQRIVSSLKGFKPKEDDAALPKENKDGRQPFGNDKEKA
jgi:hypothetical protein